MAEKLRIETGEIVLEVNDNGDTISFNPNDAKVAIMFSELIDGFEKKQKEAEMLDKKLAEIPEENIAEHLAVYGNGKLKLCLDCESEIDKIFGEGASNKVFCGQHVLEAYGVFFLEIMPYFEKARRKVLAKYKKPEKK